MAKPLARVDNRCQIAVHRLGEYDEEREYVEFWLSRPIQERISFVETLRLEYSGKEYESQPRLPRPLGPIQVIRRADYDLLPGSDKGV
ncbi:hypothetical protein FJY63_12510 [Candidatus Sumerlaeota bacterium]|nr:hypothetical protein [Candidatus Sumerlaeota bacterium]